MKKKIIKQDDLDVMVDDFLFKFEKPLSDNQKKKFVKYIRTYAPVQRKDL